MAVSQGALIQARRRAKNLAELNAELVAALKHAVECAEYCRQRHPDVQKGAAAMTEAQSVMRAIGVDKENILLLVGGL